MALPKFKSDDRLAALASQVGDAGLIRQGSHVDGAWTPGPSRGALAVTNPADGSLLCEIDTVGVETTRAAVDAAETAMTAWAGATPMHRAGLLEAWYGLIGEHREDLARIMTLEQGKPIREARGEIDYAASFVKFYAEQARRVDVESVTSQFPDADLRVSREPIGVVALVTPWNFPAAMFTRKAAAALAAGCTVVAHPSSQTPLSALALMELAVRAGFAPGVINMLVGSAREIVGELCADHRVRAMSFTGSTEIGRKLLEQCAATVKTMVMELGGHAPLLVFDDADFDRAVDQAIGAKFATSGQDCLAANRLFVQRGVYDRFTRAFAERTAALTVDQGLSEDAEIGPLMHEAAVQKCEVHVADALARGAKLLCGGERREPGSLFFQPTVLIDVPADARIMSEETFGPVAAFAPFDSEKDVIARANDSEYGLVAYLFTGDYPRISRLSRALQYGMVAVNRAKITGPTIPFGGVKQSGLGREGARHGMEAFTELKYTCIHNG